jgi:hypothetical protein
MKEHRVRVILRGGLGNQLFQYGAGFALSRKLGAALILDPRLLPSGKTTTAGVSTWPMQLGEFNHFGSIVHGIYKKPWASRLQASVMQLDRSIGDKIPSALSKLGRFSNELNADFTYFDTLERGRLILNSYCNSPRFFLEYGDQIRESILSLRQPSPAFLELKQVATKTQPLAVHVRLGDYKNLAKIYGRADTDYLERSIDLQMALSGERNIWLFSDEPRTALDLLGKYKQKAVVPPPLSELTSLETLLIMASCSGLVASNSTFSWWAAFLNNNHQAWAVFPRPFFARSGPQEPKDWLQVNWIQLGRNSD